MYFPGGLNSLISLEGNKRTLRHSCWLTDAARKPLLCPRNGPGQHGSQVSCQATLGDGSSLWWQVWSSQSGGQCCATQVTRPNRDSAGERMPTQATALLQADKGFCVPSQAWRKAGMPKPCTDRTGGRHAGFPQTAAVQMTESKRDTTKVDRQTSRPGVAFL